MAIIAGLLTGAKLLKKVGLFKRIFKKKEGGTVLGNLLRGTKRKVAVAAVTAVGQELGSTVHQVTSSMTAKNEQENGFAQGFKQGFGADWIKQNIVLVIFGGVCILGVLLMIFKMIRGK